MTAQRRAAAVTAVTSQQPVEAHAFCGLGPGGDGRGVAQFSALCFYAASMRSVGESAGDSA